MFSCKKESSIVEFNEDNQNNISILAKGEVSSVNEPEVKDWLEKQKDIYNNTPEIDKFIEDISYNLNFEKIMKEDYGDGEYIISIPVSGHLSLHDKGEKTATFLVVFEDKEGEIRRGELAILDDDNNSIDSLSMYDLYLDNPLSDDEYSLKLVSLQDYMFVDKTMSKEHLKFHNSYYGKAMGEENCIHYYWVHGTYDLETGEVLDYDVTDLGCLSCPPNAKCAVIQGGSGGGGNQTVPAIKKVTFLMGGGEIGKISYKCYALYDVTGNKNVFNPSLNTITTFQLEDDGVSMWSYPAVLPSDPLRFTISVLNHSEFFQTLPGRCNIEVLMHFTNTGGLRAFRGHHTIDGSIL